MARSTLNIVKYGPGIKNVPHHWSATCTKHFRLLIKLNKLSYIFHNFFPDGNIQMNNITKIGIHQSSTRLTLRRIYVTVCIAIYRNLQRRKIYFSSCLRWEIPWHSSGIEFCSHFNLTWLYSKWWNTQEGNQFFSNIFPI